MRGRRALPVHAAPDLESALARAIPGGVRFDTYTRHLYSTDASIYAIEPIGVVFPRHADDVIAAIEIAGRYGAPLLPRGAGTSLAGQTVGHAVILDFSHAMHSIVAIDAEARMATVQPGVVQDDLNAAASPHGLWFAPDTSTANRATIGGMIGNNSCGSRSALYGMTIDHVESLDVVLSDGSRTRLDAVTPEQLSVRARGSGLEAALYREVSALVETRADAIRDGFPPHWRRSGGYRLDRMLPEAGPFDLSKLVIGSEGTLATVVEATLRLVPRPLAVVGMAGHFDSVDAALGAVEAARECGAAAIELVDDAILDLARHSPVHGRLTEALVGRPGALLWVEFYGDSHPEVAAAASKLEAVWTRTSAGRPREHRAVNGCNGVYAVVRAKSSKQLRQFRELRKAGLALLTAAGEGGERSLAFVEDTAVDPARLQEYTRRFRGILERHGLRAGFYGHASAGCLHIRPFMNLRQPGRIDTLRAVATEVASLAAEFGGMNSSEHGDGLARAEFSRQLFGDALYECMREVKRVFDPLDRLNPGKKVDPPPMTENLRDPALPDAGPIRTHFAFDADDGMRGVANRCARIGACRKSAGSGGTMCPSYMATRDERHATRGRANALVHALSTPDPAAAFSDDGLYEILDLCLECKACRTECPLSVDMAMLKAEFLAHYHDAHGVPFGARLFGNVRTLNRVGSSFAPLSNLGSAGPSRWLLEWLAGVDRRRPLPRFRRDTLQRWFARRDHGGADAGARQVPGLGAATRPGLADGERGRVIFLADSFTSYTEPEIGRAAIELLEAAGYTVELAGDVCCGRALISKGLLRQAKAAHARLLDRLAPAALEGTPIVGCEPSCVFTLVDELPALSGDDPRAAAVARAAGLVDDLLVAAIDDGDLSLDAGSDLHRKRILLHPHCHQKAASAGGSTVSLLERLPGAMVTTLDAGCCGMAGSFGFETAHYDLSMRIGGMRLFPAVDAEPDAIIAATGTSCRQQIEHGARRVALHPVVLIRQALAGRIDAPAGGTAG
ncbi:MAG TPA: FAD-linked oxidase C-terminal domain-containing protein [Longimicrobiales bacterium]|nr:FAD-linked oxidase C-terminal domain-containing protein [Longimicrobiales bacterium]